MGLNTVGAGESDERPFTHDAWTTDDFAIAPAGTVPAGVTALGYAADKVAVAQGYVTFKQAGAQTLTFTYKVGPHNLNLVGVAAVDLAGNGGAAA